FTAPSVSGEQSVILKQNGGEWPLGKLYFAATSDILPKKIVKIIRTYEDPEDSKTETTTQEFSYDESGRLVRIKQVYNDGNEDISTIEYAEDQITITETELESLTFRLNNGRAESCVYVDKSSIESDYKYETELSYGENGYLTGYVGKSTEGTTGTGTLTTDETGFLTKISGRYEYEDSEEDNGTISIDFIPSPSVRNNLNLDLMYIDEIADFDEIAIFDGHLLGVCGKRTTYLTQQYTSTWNGEEETDPWTSKYNYVFDGEYISKIVIDDSDGGKTTLELFYEE
ncbi:MAG: DUF4595 domain-containing protein, partial [Rikenella sp.]|nr:DUF4595 domain-containing protein [Rikenella sp.]